MLFDQAIDIPSELSSEDVTVLLLDECVRFSLRVKRKDLTAFKKLSGLKLPLNIGQSTSVKNKLGFCLGPDEWLVVASVSERDELTDKLKAVSSELTCSITNIQFLKVRQLLYIEKVKPLSRLSAGDLSGHICGTSSSGW